MISTNTIYILTLQGKIVPKQRPRKSRKSKRFFLPENYRRWQSRAVAEFALQWDGKPTIEHAAVQIIFCGKLSDYPGDPDNLEGAILDALVNAKVLKDDSLKNIPEHSTKFIAANRQITHIKIRPVPPTWDASTALPRAERIVHCYPDGDGLLSTSEGDPRDGLCALGRREIGAGD